MGYFLKSKKTYQKILAVLFIGVLLVTFINPAYSAEVTNRSLDISNSVPSATNVDYEFSFNIVGNYVLGSVVFEICAEDPLPNQPCTAPVGIDTTASSLSFQNGETGFSIDASSTNERILLTRSPQINVNNNLQYIFTNINNPSTSATHYARIYTFASNDGTGPTIDYGGIAFATNRAINYEAEVPPFLYFCVGITIGGLDCRDNNTATGEFINFDEFSSGITKFATSQIMAATNASFGYNVASYGKTLSSGNNAIPALNAPQPSIAGISQFGINLRNNSVPDIGSDPVGTGSATVRNKYNQVNNFAFVNGDVLVSSVSSTEFNKYTISYIVNVSDNQKPGIYSTTILYVCLANF